MLTKVFIALLSLAIVTPSAFATPGRTDKYGCHNSQTEGYHCHHDVASNGGAIDTSFDLNAGLRFTDLSTLPFTPYLGASMGRSGSDEDISVGVNVGAVLDNGFYAGYSTTSKSVHVGYSYFHLGVSSNAVGLGFQWPIVNKESAGTSFYTSGTVLFESDSRK